MLLQILVFFLIAGAVMAPFTAGHYPGALKMLGIFMAILIATIAANIIDVRSVSGRISYGVLALTVFCAFTVGLALISNAALRIWFAIGTAMLLIEAGFRAFPRHDTSGENPGIRFFWPDLVEYPRNSLGYLDREFIIPKPGGTYRVILLGDSFTEGDGLPREKTFGRLIEKQINVEVCNLGRGGYNTKDEAESLAKFGPSLDPDLIVLNYFLNDAQTYPLQK